jgi:PhnB protein
VRTQLTVDDPASVIARAVAAVGSQVNPVGEEHGWQPGRVDDPFGHRWQIGKPLGPWPPADVDPSTDQNSPGLPGAPSP